MKKIIGALLALCMVLTMLPAVAIADEPAQLAIEAITCKPGEEITVNVTVSGNPGITYLKVKVEYNSDALTLKQAQNSGLLDGSFTASKAITTNPYVLTWTGTEDSGGNGVIAALTFAVAENAGGTQTITLAAEECYNEDFDDVEFTIVDGSVTIGGGDVEFTQVSATLGADVGLNFYTDEEAASVVFTWNGGESVAEVTGDASDSGFRYTCPLTAKEIDAQVTAEVKDAQGNTLDTVTYSVAEYLAQLTVANGYDQETENMAQATLRYGAAAKTHFLGGAAVDTPAVTEPIATYFDKNAMTIEDGNVAYYGRSLLLKDVTLLRLYFTASDTPAVRVNGATATVTPHGEAGYYTVDIPVAAGALSDGFTVTVGGTDISFTVGVQDYIATALQENQPDTTLSQLCRALYWYGAAAKALTANGGQAKSFS